MEDFRRSRCSQNNPPDGSAPGPDGGRACVGLVTVLAPTLALPQLTNDVEELLAERDIASETGGVVGE